MLKNRTLFVVGAGASNEFGLPLGTKLAEQIAAKLHFKFDFGNLIEGEHKFFSALRQNFKDTQILNNHLNACARIKSGIRLARSIDNYIDTHKEDAEVALLGKLAIIDCIAKAEKSSSLYFEPHNTNITFDTNRLAKTWIDELVGLMFNGISKSSIASVFDNLSIISFNYDRCIQQAFVLAIHTLYHIDIITCHELVNKLKIIYPYGSLGNLSLTQSAKAIPFGVEIYQPYLFELSKNIRTYSEQIADKELLDEISSEITKAKNIVFLGCAYHSQNIGILKSQNAEFDKHVFGTAIGISDSGVLQKKSDLLMGFYGLQIDAGQDRPGAALKALQNMKIHNDFGCHALMNEYRYSLQK